MFQCKAASTAAILTLAIATAVHAATGPSSSQSPYVVGLSSAVNTTSLLTVGDSVNAKPDGTPYRMVGIPDGLGLINNGNGTFTVLMNHEIGASDGIVRAHGERGSFVSEWVIDANPNGMQVYFGRDLIQNVVLNGSLSDALGRLCSGDLAPQSAYYNLNSGLGTLDRIFLSGEEAGNEGRLFGHVVTGAERGISYELPRLGKFSWENAVANPYGQDKTIVFSTDDSNPGQSYLYVGTKQASGTTVDKAGLTNGINYGIKFNELPLTAGTSVEVRSTNPADAVFTSASGTFSLVSIDTTQTGAQQNSASRTSGVTEFLRPEDAAWDPSNPNSLYFVTTDGPLPNGRSRLYRMTLDSITDPTVGGQIEMLLDGTEGQFMFDNITIDRYGHILLQEDPGNVAHLAKIWAYDIYSDTLTAIAQHDPARFITGAPGFLTQDEESSGIIDAEDVLGKGWFILDVQAHRNLGGELVQDGQLLAMHVDFAALGGASVPEPASLGVLGVGVLALIARRRRLG